MPIKRDEKREQLIRLSCREFLVRSAQGIAGLAWLAACAPSTTPTQPASTLVPWMPTPASTHTPAVNLDTKIGQMILVGFRGFDLANDNPIVADLRERQIGGVVLFDYDSPTRTRLRNIQSPRRV